VLDKANFIGSDIFPTTFAISEFLKKYFLPCYASSTFEMNQSRVVSNYQKDKYLKFLEKIKLNKHLLCKNQENENTIPIS
jgi:hypothetical protein